MIPKIIRESEKRPHFCRLSWHRKVGHAFYLFGTHSYTILRYFIHDTAPITLMTDASDYGIGGYLYRV